MQFSQHVEVNSFLQSLEYSYRIPVLQFRRFLFQATDELDECIKRGTLVFSVCNEEFCVIKVVKNSVRLIFLNGAELSDNHNLLKSFGLKSRCIELYECNSKLMGILPKYIGESISIVKQHTELT
ncbi:DUF1801 domain-containing protein [Chondrinema litorale]|uniref:DUF1801 domain-containing protein n=1 Tax=Chondrinema litorale TaxID=2994555 RepID=UPI002542E8A2|nr:DUF1801 domain-containing protein [Chondrinema litorale]UZR94741.1 DUF1801 domain-containing protein [Chondrinema litorale]